MAVSVPGGSIGATGIIRPATESGDAAFDLLARLKPAWARDAACREPRPGVTFFPELGQPVAPAKAVCGCCPVREECLTYALDHHLDGVWGGTTRRERAALRRASSAA